MNKILYNNPVDLTIFAYQCGITLKKAPHNHHRRVNTGANPTPTIMMASLHMYTKQMSIEEKNNILSNLHILSIININDNLVNDVLSYIIDYNPHLTMIDLSGCTHVDERTI